MKKFISLFCILFLNNSFSQTLSYFENTPDELNPSNDAYVGDWVGTGWGWEIRFKQSAGEFGKQFARGKIDLPFENEKIIMSLMVTHTTHFYLKIDKSGNIKGEGIITYDLIPNLCGLAALTKQVNEAINMMDKIPSIFKWSGELSKKAIKNFNREWADEYSKYAGSLEELSSITEQSGSVSQEEIKSFVEKWITGAWYSDDIRQLAASIISNRCSSGEHNFGNDIDCKLIVALLNKNVTESVSKMALDKLIDQVLSKLSEKYKEKMKGIALDSQKGEELCKCGAGASVVAGNKFGPTTLEELVMQFGPDILDAAMFQAALGSAPFGLVLSIPGVTQVQYYYKGLKDGPENRKFKIKGKLISGKLYLEMNGDVYDGDKNLTVEYQVNYKKETPKFPCWTPFRKDGAAVKESGKETIYESKEFVTIKEFKDPATGKKITIEVPERVTSKKEIFQHTPFATFRETGNHRDGKSMWHDYEYVWNVHRITTPKKK
ncbi:MAG: hypothetical protein KJN64_15890 [Ignavibacteria bacterium]|nr:hypothetical protein [Ignavibacteria bacterium]MBT8381713.1 hypothetical protein [Ignavibacteria bacterium]MBT8392649.1 hypothetical protein [Ignavibacteria bacterium]NNJ54218.1 hypothetical protein [Ignavibacteriaceae bacterium]NNL21119.1 hypothetical protein [Ignavibacteriaceae bacterium]